MLDNAQKCPEMLQECLKNVQQCWVQKELIGLKKNSFSSSLLPPEKLKKLEGPGLAAVELAGTVDRDYNSHMNIKSFFLLEMP